MRTYQKFLAVIALSGLCLMPAAASENAGAVKKSKKSAKTAAVEAKPPCEACEAIKRLEDKVAAQQAEIDALKAAQAQPAAAPPPPTDDQARAAAAAAQEKAAAAEAAAAEAKAKADAAAAENAELKKSLEETSTIAQNADKKVKEFEAPAYIHYKNIKITPGGFLAADQVWRQRLISADTYSDFTKVPFSGNADHMTEYRISARPSRISVLAEGAVKDTKLSGYFEMDFEGAAPTANENQSSSFNPRVRQAFGQASWHGWTFTGGQTWTLLTLSKSGIKARDEWIPATSDGNYLPGYTQARLATFRVAKVLADGRATAAFSVENPATLVAGSGPGVAGAVTSFPGNTNLNNGTNFSANLAPDLMAKVAFDPSFAHFEVKAVGRFFRDRFAGVNNTEVQGGFGAGVIVPVLHKKINLIADGMAGRGIARYGISGNQAKADITIFTNGSIHPLVEIHGLGGIEAHVTPKLDWYLYGGEDYIRRDNDGTSGYGLAGAANFKSIIQGTSGIWYTMYKGGYGSLRYGAQYSWTYLSTWATPAPNNKTNDSMAFTSLRYVLP